MLLRKGPSEEQDEAEGDPERKKLLDVEQQAVKPRQQMYGYYGFQRALVLQGMRGAIAGWGREYIHKTIKVRRRTFLRSYRRHRQRLPYRRTQGHRRDNQAGDGVPKED